MEKAKFTQKELLEAYKKGLKDASIDIQQEISLCLSDLPKTHMTKTKSGKIYINLVVAMRKEPDQWGRDLKVYVQPTKKDKEERNPKTYVGGGKTFIFAEAQAETPTEDDLNQLLPTNEALPTDDLPY